jgi:hypothetical protein
MSTRFSRANRSYPKRGRPATIRQLKVINYNDYKVEYDYYDIAEVYLVSIYHHSPPKQPLLEFLLDPQELGGQGVENYLLVFIEKFEQHIENNSVKNEMSKLYNQPYSSITDEQKAAYIRAKEIVKLKFSNFS